MWRSIIPQDCPEWPAQCLRAMLFIVTCSCMLLNLLLSTSASPAATLTPQRPCLRISACLLREHRHSVCMLITNSCTPLKAAAAKPVHYSERGMPAVLRTFLVALNKVCQSYESCIRAVLDAVLGAKPVELQLPSSYCCCPGAASRMPCRGGWWLMRSNW